MRFRHFALALLFAAAALVSCNEKTPVGVLTEPTPPPPTSPVRSIR